jgi:prophage regulatory protein
VAAEQKVHLSTKMKRILSSAELRKAVPYSLTHIYRLEKKGEFPRRIKVGRNRVGWMEAEIQAWVETRMQARGQPEHPSKGRRI